MTRCRNVLLLFALTLPAAGCIAPVNYAPNTNILNEIGLHQGQTLLAEILTRCRNPRIVDVEVTTDYFSFTTYGPYHHGWYVYGMVGNTMTIYYNNVNAVDIYQNDRVMVYDLAGRRIGQFDFLTREDSLHFTDLVHAFRDAGTSWPAPHHDAPAEPRDDYTEPPPPPPPPPAEEENTRNVLQPDPDEDPLLHKAPPPPVEEPPPVEPVDPGDDEENTRNLLDED